MTPDHHQPAEDAQILFPLPLATYLHDGDLEPGQDQELAPILCGACAEPFEPDDAQ